MDSNGAYAKSLVGRATRHNILWTGRSGTGQILVCETEDIVEGHSKQKAK